MSEQASMPTRLALVQLGFVPDPTVVHTDEKPGLSFDFGNFKLSACWVINRQFVPCVVFSGTLITHRTLGQVWFELHRTVESREQCAAFIACSLDKYVIHGQFEPLREVPWLAEGRNHKHLLPWERSMAAYRARPQCTVERDWLKLALKSLSQYLAHATDTQPVEIGFDGEVLSFRLAKDLVALPAKGSPWNAGFAILAGKLRNLPKRLMREHLGVSIDSSRLTIAKWSYEGVTEIVRDVKPTSDA